MTWTGNQSMSWNKTDDPGSGSLECVTRLFREEETTPRPLLMAGDQNVPLLVQRLQPILYNQGVFYLAWPWLPFKAFTGTKADTLIKLL